MNPGEHPWTSWKGATFSERFRVAIGGVPVDLTGYTGKMEVRAGPGGGVILTFSTTDGSMVLGADGWVTMLKSAAAMGDDAVVAGKYRYDLRLSHGGVTDVWLKGPFIIEPGITE